MIGILNFVYFCVVVRWWDGIAVVGVTKSRFLVELFRLNPFLTSFTRFLFFMYFLSSSRLSQFADSRYLFSIDEVFWPTKGINYFWVEIKKKMKVIPILNKIYQLLLKLLSISYFFVFWCNYIELPSILEYLDKGPLEEISSEQLVRSKYHLTFVLHILNKKFLALMRWAVPIVIFLKLLLIYQIIFCKKIYLQVFHRFQRRMRLTIDRNICTAVLVTNGDWKSTKIGPNNL